MASCRPPLPRRSRRVVAFGPYPQVTDLVPVIQDSMDVRCLKLRGCALDDATAQQLSSAIAFNTSLVSLDLRDNCISGKWSAAGTSLLLRACRRPTRPAHAWQLQGLWQGSLESPAALLSQSPLLSHARCCPCLRAPRLQAWALPTWPTRCATTTPRCWPVTCEVGAAAPCRAPHNKVVGELTTRSLGSSQQSAMLAAGCWQDPTPRR